MFRPAEIIIRRSLNIYPSSLNCQLKWINFLHLIFFNKAVIFMKGRAIAQAISRLLPTAAARVRSQVRSCGICGGLIGAGAVFLRVLRFPLPVLMPPSAPHSSSSIIRGWCNRPNSGRRTKWTQSCPTPRN
jgi:hypothetical protein